MKLRTPPAPIVLAPRTQNIDLYMTLVWRHQGHGVMPYSLKVKTIPTLMAASAKGGANSPELATRGNYRSVTALGMAQAHSMDLARRLLLVAYFGPRAFRYNASI